MERNPHNVDHERAKDLLERLKDVDPLQTMDCEDFETGLLYVLDHSRTAKYIAKFEGQLHAGRIPYGTLKAYLTTYLK
ncbi:TPA: hypothetical protein HA265_03380 [Candidatus Woesearchaeota archaeon]|nr:hypothetical protein [Candidatus Woesearchaeota archaeon]